MSLFSLPVRIPPLMSLVVFPTSICVSPSPHLCPYSNSSSSPCTLPSMKAYPHQVSPTESHQILIPPVHGNSCSVPHHVSNVASISHHASVPNHASNVASVPQCSLPPSSGQTFATRYYPVATPSFMSGPRSGPLSTPHASAVLSLWLFNCFWNLFVCLSLPPHLMNCCGC